MKKDFSFDIQVVRVRPHDFTGKCAAFKEKNPPLSLVENRTDLILLSGHDHLAVVMTCANLDCLSTFPALVRRKLDIRLVDTTLGTPVLSGICHVAIPAHTYTKEVYCSLPLCSRAIDARHDFRVEVAAHRSGVVYITKPVRFFALSQIRRVPTRFYRLQRASLTDGGPGADTGYLSIDPASKKNFQLSLTFEVDGQMPEKKLPEVELHVTRPDGWRVTRFCRPEEESSDSPDDTRRATVTTPVDFLTDTEGAYYVEVRCMGYAFSGFMFTTAWGDIRGEATGSYLGVRYDFPSERDLGQLAEMLGESKEPAANPEMENPGAREDDEEEPSRIPTAEEKLHSLTGLDNIKAQVRRYRDVARFSLLRAEAGLPTMPFPLHSVFLGAPGTGKTTVAKIMGEMLHEAGVLSKGHVVMRERATLLGQYYSSEAQNTLVALEEAQGGILFIDEAYQLFQPHDPKDPGRFVLESLLTALADESKRDWMLVLAGYTEPMQAMLDCNPGLRSRIPETNLLTFEDYTEAQLVEIADCYLSRFRYTLSNPARLRLCRTIAADYRRRTSTFGNARYVMNLIQTGILPAMAQRLADKQGLTESQLSAIEETDIPQPSLSVRPARRPIGFV